MSSAVLALPAVAVPDAEPGFEDSDASARIARRLSVSELVATYAQAERDIIAGFALVAEAEKRLKVAFEGNNNWIRVHGSRGTINFDDSETSVKHVRRQVWQALIAHLELRRFMSISAFEDLEKQIEREDPPEITIDTVTQMAEQFRAQMPDMLKAAVGEVFEFLRPHNDRYVRNSQLEIPQRVILSWMVESAWPGRAFRPQYNREPQLTALENVVTALDGKGSVTKGHYSNLSAAIKESPDGHGETEYFEFRACKNRNLHLTFRRLDLLKRLNQIAGGKRLRPNTTGETK